MVQAHSCRSHGAFNPGQIYPTIDDRNCSLQVPFPHTPTRCAIGEGDQSRVFSPTVPVNIECPRRVASVVLPTLSVWIYTRCDLGDGQIQ